MDELRANSFHWLQNAHLKPVIESLFVAAQDQALHINWLGFHIMKNSTVADTGGLQWFPRKPPFKLCARP